MLWFLILCAVIASCYGVNGSNNTQFPLCTLCKCQMKTVDAVKYADVVCFTKVYHDIFSPEFWVTTVDNKTHEYNYHSLNFQNNILTNLSKEFPSSNLVYLNLASNNMVSITQSVFRNLQKMEILVLSYNDLDDIDPEAFRVSYVFYEMYLEC